MRWFVLLMLAFPSALSQTLPDGAGAPPDFQCSLPDDLREPQNEAERLELQRRARYRAVLPAYLAVVPSTPDATLLMPVEGVRVRDVADTWGAARGGGRTHEGQDIFAEVGTPVYAAAPGYVYHAGTTPLGGNVVTIVGGGGRRYYYAHLSALGDIREGQRVTTDTLIGFVGDSGNARSTPYHLHFGVYEGNEDPCAWEAIDPLPLMTDR